MAAAAALCVLFSDMAMAQAPRPQGPPPVISPEVQSDRRITFRIYRAARRKRCGCRQATFRAMGPWAAMTKGDNGVWEATFGPVDPGAYRYNFKVDGVPVIDPRNPATSESNNNIWSLVVVPGSEFMDTKDVPHGAVAAVTYYSTTLEKFRRMHVYTPPGYETGSGNYPVFYLLHGAGDSDDSWTSVGRAGFILDNLIAAGKAKPMIVVMPAGHTRRFSFGGPPAPARVQPADEFDAGLPQRPHAVCREELPRDGRPQEPRHRRPVDGRRADAEHRHPAPGRSPTSASSAPASSARSRPAAGRRHAAAAPNGRRRGRSSTRRRWTTPLRRA